MNDPDLMTDEDLAAAWEAMPAEQKRQAIRNALNEEMGSVPFPMPDNPRPLDCDGLSSIPLGAPWPPLSREQVVALHEALVRFRRVCRDTLDFNWAGKVLYETLRDLGIGSPPPDVHSTPREEPTTDEDSGPGAMSWQQAEEA
jgi:hypothetical protein